MTFRRFDPNALLVVSGAIRLADKYCIDNLREHLINVVVSDWPTTLEEWDFFQTEIQAVKDKLEATNCGKAVGEGYQPLSEHLPELASAIMFAQEFGCSQILRAAYYHHLSILPRHTWDASWRTRSAEPLCARWSLLDSNVLLRCMKGAEDVLIYKPWAYELRRMNCPSQVLPIGGDRAFCSHPCVVFLQDLVTSVWSAPLRSERDPLGLLLECLERANVYGENRSGELCSACRSSLHDRVAHLRRELWDQLSRYFDLKDL